MKKILFVISTLNTGGAQRAFSNIIMELPEEYEINILLNDSENIVYPYKGKIIDLGIAPEKNKTKITYQIKVFIKRYFALRKLKREKGYVACISALESANFVNILTGRKKCKCIISIRNFNEKKSGKKFIAWLISCVMKKFYNYADKIVAVSEGIRESLINDYHLNADKICTIYNGYNVEKIIKDSQMPIGDNIKIDLSGNAIVASGRLTEQKGFEYLIRCFSKIAYDFPDSKLIILGEGELREHLYEYIVKLGLQSRIFMPGFVKNPYAIISKCKIFVLSSLYEGYPNVLAEAIICGIPCIATDCRTGPREILANGVEKEDKMLFEEAKYGILCTSFLSNEDKAEESVEGALRELLTNSRLYNEYKCNCILKRKEMEMKHIIQQWISIIEE